MGINPKRYYGGITVSAAKYFKCTLKVIFHPLHSMNKCVTNKAKLPQDGAQVFPYMG